MKANNIIGIIIVIATKIKSILIALFFNTFWFLFKKIDDTYCIKFITFELITLTILADIKPLKLDVPIVNNSGIEVAYPAISPTVFGFKFSVSASFLNVVTNTYFEIITIIPE